jgi:hypothetical protein
MVTAALVDPGIVWKGRGVSEVWFLSFYPVVPGANSALIFGILWASVEKTSEGGGKPKFIYSLVSEAIHAHIPFFSIRLSLQLSTG